MPIKAALLSAINKLDEQIPRLNQSLLDDAPRYQIYVDDALDEKLAKLGELAEYAESHANNVFLHLALSKNRIDKARKCLMESDYDGAIFNYGKASGYFHSAKAIAYKNRIKKYPLKRAGNSKFENKYKQKECLIADEYSKNKDTYLGKRGKPTKSKAIEVLAEKYELSGKTINKIIGTC